MAITLNQWHYFGLTTWATSRLGLNEWLLRRVRDPGLVDEYHFRTEYRINSIRSVSRHLDRAGFSAVEFRWDLPRAYEPYLPHRLAGLHRPGAGPRTGIHSPHLMGHPRLQGGARAVTRRRSSRVPGRSSRVDAATPSPSGWGSLCVRSDRPGSSNEEGQLLVVVGAAGGTSPSVADLLRGVGDGLGGVRGGLLGGGPVALALLWGRGGPLAGLGGGAFLAAVLAADALFVADFFAAVLRAVPSSWCGGLRVDGLLGLRRGGLRLGHGRAAPPSRLGGLLAADPGH